MKQVHQSLSKRSIDGSVRAAWLHVCLVFLLVLAPALSGMHAVVHAPQLAHSVSAHDDHAVGDLFGDHAMLDCLVLDQLCHSADAVHTLWQPPPPLPNAAPAFSVQSTLPASPRLGFEARAPPKSFLG